jgi:hypothetical protein
MDILDAGFDAAPHLSCIGSSRAELAATLELYRARGIRHLVALRGDLPSGMASAGEASATPPVSSGAYIAKSATPASSAVRNASGSASPLTETPRSSTPTPHACRARTEAQSAPTRPHRVRMSKNAMDAA